MSEVIPVVGGVFSSPLPVGVTLGSILGAGAAAMALLARAVKPILFRNSCGSARTKGVAAGLDEGAGCPLDLGGVLEVLFNISMAF